MINIKENCKREALDCIKFYNGKTNVKTRKDILYWLGEISLLIKRMVFSNSKDIEDLVIKAGIIQIIMLKKAYTHRKFKIEVAKVCTIAKPEYTTQDFIYSVFKALDPKWEVE